MNSPCSQTMEQRPLEAITKTDLSRTRQLNILQRPKGRGGCVVAVDELLGRAVVGDVVDVQIGLYGLTICDAKLASDQGVPLQQPRAPDLADAAVCVLEAIGGCQRI